MLCMFLKDWLWELPRCEGQTPQRYGTWSSARNSLLGLQNSVVSYSEYFEYTEKTKEYSSTPLRSGTSLQDTFKRIKFISSVQHP
jgi:hypothetical protein